jgi:uncharacterized small protein (DUF1192 family)
MFEEYSICELVEKRDRARRALRRAVSLRKVNKLSDRVLELQREITARKAYYVKSE